jgi:hypothetical protein
MRRYILLLILSFKCSLGFGSQGGIVSNTIGVVKRMIDTTRSTSVDKGKHNVYVLSVKAVDSVDYCATVRYIITEDELNSLPFKESVVVIDSQFVILDVPTFLYSKIAQEYHVAPFRNLRQSLYKKLILAKDGFVIFDRFSSAIVLCHNSNNQLSKFFQHSDDIPNGISPYNFQEMFKDKHQPPKMDTIPIIPHNVN